MMKKLTPFLLTMSLPLCGLACPDRFKDQVVFITGGTSGIGLATAVQFAAAGAAHVVVCGRSSEKWTSAQPYIKSHLAPALASHLEYWPCDVRVESQVKNTIQKIFYTYGRLDVAFNNAGVQPGDVSLSGHIEQLEFPSKVAPDGTIEYFLSPPQPTSNDKISGAWRSKTPTQSTPISAYRESPLATNVFGIFYCLKWELAYAFKRQPKNLPVSIINNASRNGIIPTSSRPLYGAAKAFMISLTRSLSSQAAQRSLQQGRAVIRINAISPGPVDTPLERSAFPGNSLIKAMAGVPMQRIAQPEEIAPAVLFLADNKQSSYITGAILPIDGGHVASPLLAIGPNVGKATENPAIKKPAVPTDR